MLSLSACSSNTNTSSTDSTNETEANTKSTKLAETYDFYEESITILENDMNIDTEKANSVFEALIEVGLDEKITYCYDRDDYFKVWWGLTSVDVYLSDGAVDKIMNEDEQIYPVVAKEENENSNTDEIIWKDDEKIGIVNLQLDGTKIKESIINDYYMGVANYINNIDKTTLKEYDYLQFSGNVIRDGKTECTIKGNMSIPAIKNNDDRLNFMDIENNIVDLFIPKPLQ